MSHRTYRNARLARRKAGVRSRGGRVLTSRGVERHLATAECLLYVSTPHGAGPHTWIFAAPPGQVPSSVEGGSLLFGPGRMRTAPASGSQWVCRRGLPPLPLGIKLRRAKAARLIAHAADHGTPVIDLAAAFKSAARTAP